MWSFIIIDTKGFKKIKDVFSFLNKNYDSPEIIYCHTTNKDYENVKNYIFKKEENVEAILNAVSKECNGDKIVVVRSVEDFKDIVKLTDCITQDNQVAYFSLTKKGIKNWLKLKMIKILNFVLGQGLENISYNIVAYGKIASLALKNAINPSMLTRTNNFVGITYVPVDGGKKYVFKYNKLKAILAFGIPVILLIATIIIRVLIKQDIGFIFNILFVGLILLEFMFSLLFGSVWFIKSQIGDNVTNSARYK